MKPARASTDAMYLLQIGWIGHIQLWFVTSWHMRPLTVAGVQRWIAGPSSRVKFCEGFWSIRPLTRLWPNWLSGKASSSRIGGSIAQGKSIVNVLPGFCMCMLAWSCYASLSRTYLCTQRDTPRLGILHLPSIRRHHSLDVAGHIVSQRGCCCIAMSSARRGHSI